MTNLFALRQPLFLCLWHSWNFNMELFQFFFLNLFTSLLVFSNSSCTSFFGTDLLELVFFFVAVVVRGFALVVVELIFIQSLDRSSTFRSLVWEKPLKAAK